MIVGIVVAVLVVVGGAAATVLVLNHRADVAAQERKDEAAREAHEERQAEAEAKAAREAAALAEARATYKACAEQLDPLMTLLSNIDARLDVGLTQTQLSDMLGKASIAYNRINVESLGKSTCLSVGAKLEGAFNKYNSTVSPWADCIYDYYCSVDDDVLPGMQVKWAKASGLIAQAKTLLATLDPDGATYDATAAGDPI